MRLKGKVAIVTGASSGIGAGIAKAFGAEGATVIVNYSASKAGADDVVASIVTNGGTAVAVQADMASSTDVIRLFETAVAEHGRLDILVNNAGIALGGPIDAFGLDDLQRMLAVNVTGTVVATQEAVRHMGAGGRVVNIGSSMTRYAAFGGASLYTLTKGAISGFQRSLARDLGPRGITVNTVHPGPTDTDMNPANGPVAALVGPGIAVGRYAQPAEIAGVVAFLAGPEAAFVNGADWMVDGGLSA